VTANESLRQPFSDEVTLRAIVEGVESETGERFFSSLVKHLAAALGCQYAFVSELSSDRLHFRTRAAWGRGKLIENFEIPLVGTPCEPVLSGNSTHHPENLCRLFPTNPPFLSEWGVESYCGVPLLDSSGAVTGHLAILSEEPMKDGPRGLAIMRIFAARAQAEIERLRVENALHVSEERLNRVLHSTLDAIVTFDANRSVVLFNRSAESVFRCSAADAIGRALDPFISDKLKEIIEKAISRNTVLESHRDSWAFDGVTARRAGGDEFAIEATISQVETKGGKLFTLILRDIEERLRLRELSLRLLVDSIPAPVAVMTPTGQVESVNQLALKYFGKTFDELKRWGTSDAVHPDDLPRAIAVWMEAIETGQPYEIKQRLRRFDGVYRWFDVRGFPLRVPDGHILNWCVLLSDIDDRERAVEALRASERSLSLNINAMPTLLAAARPDGWGDFFNRRWLDYTGLSAEQLEGWGWATPLHPDDAEGLLKIWRSSLLSGAPLEAEARMRRFDGEYRWHLFRANALRDELGNIVKWYGTASDIHPRKQAQEELRRSEAFLAEGQRLSSTGSSSWRVATDEITFSKELYRIFELEPDIPLTHQLLHSRIHPEDLPMIQENTARFRQNPTDFEHDFRLLLPDRSVKYIHVVTHFSRDESGQLMYTSTYQDVTHRRRAEEALTKARTELARMARVTSFAELTASIAHEINQPLSGIVTNASTCLLMLDSDPPNVEVARETARRALRDGDRASKIIKRLRALFSRKPVVTGPVDLNEAAREVIALTLSELQRNRVFLRTDFDSELPLITGDRVQLQQVILNLLRNASDAMAAVQDRPKHMLIRTEREEGGGVRLTVQDVGVGFDPDAMDKLFQAFYTTKHDGMGMGLSISRSIVESHHGRLWATRNDGPGATFSFSLPCRPASENMA
jgi:PAS domain S-box-containing protein